MDEGRIGRPSSYTPQVGEAICERLIEGESVLEICSDPKMPARKTIYRWLESNEAFRHKFARAREEMAHFHFDAMWAIAKDDKGDVFYDNDGKAVADHARIQRDKLKIDVLKFRAMKLLPRVYGDRPQEDIEAAGPLVITWARADSVVPEPPPREHPPKQLTYQKRPLPADLPEEAWAKLIGILDLMDRIVPGDSDPTYVLGIVEDALRQHFLASADAVSAKTD